MNHRWLGRQYMILVFQWHKQFVIVQYDVKGIRATLIFNTKGPAQSGRYQKLNLK